MRDNNQSAMKRELIRAHYERRVLPGRDSYDILDWGNRESQLARFHVFMDVLIKYQLISASSPAAHLVLDIGCGLTDLCTVLGERRLPVMYTGVDIVPAILEEARRRHPDRHLLLADIFANEPFRPATFDTAFCSGTLNLKIGNNEDFARRAMAVMLPLVRQCLVINFLHCRAACKYDHCYYYVPDELLMAVPAEAREVEVIDDYLENDFTMVLWK